MNYLIPFFQPLRLIIMSATLRVSDFAENKTLFTSPPPVINVAARQHPVTIHFSRRTYPDYVTQAIKKSIKIHTRLPPGGILIFLTGQAEIAGVCRKLEEKFGRKAINEKQKRRGQGQPRRDNEDEDIWLQSDVKQSVNFAQGKKYRVFFQTNSMPTLMQRPWKPRTLILDKTI